MSNWPVQGERISINPAKGATVEVNKASRFFPKILEELTKTKEQNQQLANIFAERVASFETEAGKVETAADTAASKARGA